MAHVCPFWIGYVLASPLRKLIQHPESILGPYIEPGMAVLDAGCAMGFFSLPMAEMVGAGGKVVCVDFQPKMLRVLEKKADKAGLLDRIETRVCDQASLHLDPYDGAFDFALAFAVLHEVSDQSKFLRELARAVKPGGRLLLSEPSGHVRKKAFEKSVEAARENHFILVERAAIRLAITAVLEKAA